MKLNFAFWHHYLMRLKPAHSVLPIVVFLTLFFAMPAGAQEERQGETEPIAKETPRTDPDPAVSDSDIRTGNRPNVIPAALKEAKEAPKDSIVQNKVIRHLRPVEKVPKEEDPLSFNFLYYIIEKFKLSDIIE
jgi:hypothetical protein